MPGKVLRAKLQIGICSTMRDDIIFLGNHVGKLQFREFCSVTFLYWMPANHFEALALENDNQ